MLTQVIFLQAEDREQKRKRSQDKSSLPQKQRRIRLRLPQPPVRNTTGENTTGESTTGENITGENAIRRKNITGEENAIGKNASHIPFLFYATKLTQPKSLQAKNREQKRQKRLQEDESFLPQKRQQLLPPTVSKTSSEEACYTPSCCATELT
jgi:hypothetical protein